MNINIRNVIFLQSLFCISRLHYIEKGLYSILGNILFYTSLTTIVSFNVYEIISIIYDRTKYNLPITTIFFAYSLHCLLLVQLICLSVNAKWNNNVHEQLKILEEKCKKELAFTIHPQLAEKSSNRSSKSMIILSVISALIDLFGVHFLEYPTVTVATLTVAFAAHDTEMLLYSLIINEYNAKLATLDFGNTQRGTKMYRHILISTSHFTEDFRFTVSLMVFVTLITTILYLGVPMVVDEPRTIKVLTYLTWRELRSLLSLWMLCSASHQTGILYNRFIKRLSELVVFEMDSKDQSDCKLTKRWLRYAKSLQVKYTLDCSCFALDPSLPFNLLDYTTNFLLIAVQVYPLIK